VAKKKQPEVPGMVEQLREAIRASGRSLNQLGKETGVGADRLSRFVRGQRDLVLSAAERVCRALGLGLASLDEPPATEEGPKRKRNK
jgi:transcriptional regulator with XRE-family HTH domain